MMKGIGTTVLLLLAIIATLSNGKFVLRKHWVRCPRWATSECAKLNMVACARDRNGRLKEYGNSCLACQDSQVIYSRPGPCNQHQHQRTSRDYSS